MEWMKYPSEDDMECGCKVSWNYYRDEGKAKKCAEAAKHNASIQRSQGYDFGYCMPGSIEKVGKGERAGMFRVCLP